MMVFHTSLLSEMPFVRVLLRYLHSKCLASVPNHVAKTWRRERARARSYKKALKLICLIFTVNSVWQPQIVLWINKTTWGSIAV